MFGKKKDKSTKEQGTAIFINEVGSIKPRVFNILERKDGLIKVDFGNGEIYNVKEKYLRIKRVVMFKTSSGKVIVKNPDNWKNIDLKKYDIKELRFNLQNFGLQEGKSAIHRWTLPPDTLTKLSPLFKLLIIAIVVGVVGWAAMKFGTYVLDVVMKSRLYDCSQVLPKPPIPIGAISPIGSNITG